MHTNRSIEILTKLKVVIFTSIVLLFLTQISIKAEPRAYYGVNYYSYTERTDEQDPFMELKTNIPTLIFGLRDETAIRSNKSSDKFSYMVEGTLGNVNIYSIHRYWLSHSQLLDNSNRRLVCATFLFLCWCRLSIFKRLFKCWRIWWL